ncbi:hypothetical protein KQH60_00940 [Mycetohabitans sp. B8]|uniref:hypothetical protein n=1 Tax=Mycetohabitans sp. B8 TaxID=2841845 RepID=UPI001F1B3125|nr:hypothetical protein [Mycetohabitans sp. B8]MCG1041207.1 hypothetical protein [Mycetohabitans sp. B8]
MNAIVLMLLFTLVSAPVWSDIGQYTTATSTPQDGVMRVQGIQITDIVAEDTACPENGRIARDANGTPLFCQSGRWSYATASGGRYVCFGHKECGFSTKYKKDGEITMLHLIKRNESKRTQWFMISSIPKEYDHGVCRVKGYVSKEKPEAWLGDDIKLTELEKAGEYGLLKNGDRGCSVIIPVTPGSFGTLSISNVSREKDGSEIGMGNWTYHVSIYE